MPMQTARQLGFALLLLAAAARAEVTLEAVRALPPLPETFPSDAALDARVDWLQARLAATGDDTERYRTQRLLFDEYYYERQDQAAAAVCRENPPLRLDFAYRERCILASVSEYEAYMPALLSLASEARQSPEKAAAAALLKDVAWRQSQWGDIAGAFENFEAALAIAPADNAELLGEIMMDTATSYIVNGDESYVRRGLALLADARVQMQRALDDPKDSSDKRYLGDKVVLTGFNSGIAYALHLSDYEKALASFAQVADQDSPYREDALVFAALSAAELGRFEAARAYLARSESEKGDASLSGPVAQQYLQCYRQITARRWDRGHPVDACLALKPETSLEVQLDVFKRLSESDDAATARAGLIGLKRLLVEKVEPQLRRRASGAASNAELMRLQRESDLKSVVLKQQEALQRERDETNAQRQNFFIALSLLLLMAALLAATRLRAKKRLAEQYEQLSLADALTHLGNRRYLEQHIGRELSLLNRMRHEDPAVSLGIYLFDIDHFKSVNDRFGHAAGDEVLVEMSRRIKVATRGADLLVRWGGEEFLLVARVDNGARCAQIADRILRAVNETPFEISGHGPLAVTCTIGAVTCPFIEGDNTPIWNELVGIADQALYLGKSGGRNRWLIVDNVRVAAAEDVGALLAQPLQQAVDAGLVSLRTS
ncbi:GGDEF domain-containing protein [Arenimonas metalli]|nr:GGDEF domain-containing protein [Arenimonas metalli]